MSFVNKFSIKNCSIALLLIKLFYSQISNYNCFCDGKRVFPLPSLLFPAIHICMAGKLIQMQGP